MARAKEPNYFGLNVVLLLLAVGAGYTWFAAHVRPHMATFLFGGVTALAIGGVVYAVASALFGKEATSSIRAFLTQGAASIVLVVALAVIAILFAITGTVYFASSEKLVQLSVARDGKAPETVTIDEENKTPALTYFGLFKPITLTIATTAPRGYGPREGYRLRRGWPVTERVPYPDLRKKFFLVRLVPFKHFFSNRGRTTPDPRYRLTITVPNEPPHVLEGLSFRAILLGASQADLEELARTTRTNDRFLRNQLAGHPETDAIIKEWLDDPVLIATRELKPGVDEVLVDLTPTTETGQVRIPVKTELNEYLLKGVPKGERK